MTLCTLKHTLDSCAYITSIIQFTDESQNHPGRLIFSYGTFRDKSTLHSRRRVLECLSHMMRKGLLFLFYSLEHSFSSLLRSRSDVLTNFNSLSPVWPYAKLMLEEEEVVTGRMYWDEMKIVYLFLSP